MDAQRTFKTPDIIDRTATPREPQEINNASQIRIKCLGPGSKDTELLAPENGFRRSGALTKKKQKNGKQSNRIMQELQRHVYVSESTTTIKGFSNWDRISQSHGFLLRTEFGKGTCHKHDTPIGREPVTVNEFWNVKANPHRVCNISWLNELFLIQFFYQHLSSKGKVGNTDHTRYYRWRPYAVSYCMNAHYLAQWSEPKSH